MIKVKYNEGRPILFSPDLDAPTMNVVSVPVIVDYDATTDARVMNIRNTAIDPYIEFIGFPTECDFCYYEASGIEIAIKMDFEDGLDIYSQLVGDVPLLEKMLANDESKDKEK